MNIPKNRFFFIFLLGIFASCGTSKEKSSGVKSPKSTKETAAFSAKDYPYLEAFHSALRLKTVGDIDGAISGLNKCLTIRQNDDAVHYALAQLEVEKGNKVSALDHFTKASNIDPSNIWYVKEIAYVHYENQEFEKAIPEFKKLVNYESKNLEWLYGYGDCLLRTGKTQESINVLTKAEDVMGVNPSLSVEKYNLYMQLKKESEALQEINKAREVYPDDPQLIATLVDHYFQKGETQKAVGFLEELVKNDPENGRAHIALGDIYMQQNKPEAAFEEFRKAFSCADVDIDTKMKLLIAIQESSYKPNENAVGLMELMVSQHPEDARSYAIKGDYMLALDNKPEAILAYKKAVEIEKDQFPIWNQLLLLEYQKGDFEDLYKDSKTCLSYFSTFPTIYLLNGIGAIQNNHLDEAIESLETGKSLLVNDKPMEAEFYSQLGEAFMQKKEYAEGQKNFEKALELDPKSNLIRNNYAYKLAIAKINLDKALILISQATQSSPNQSTYMDTKGLILFQQGKYEEATILFEEALKLNNEEPDINDHLGDAYVMQNMSEKAVEQWLKSKKLGSKNKNLNKKIESKKYYEPIYY